MLISTTHWGNVFFSYLGTLLFWTAFVNGSVTFECYVKWYRSLNAKIKILSASTNCCISFFVNLSLHAFRWSCYVIAFDRALQSTSFSAIKKLISVIIDGLVNVDNRWFSSDFRWLSRVRENIVEKHVRIVWNDANMVEMWVISVFLAVNIFQHIVLYLNTTTL